MARKSVLSHASDLGQDLRFDTEVSAAG